MAPANVRTKPSLRSSPEKGKRGNRSLSLYYMLPYSTAEIVKLEVIKPGGKVAIVDVAPIQGNDR